LEAVPPTLRAIADLSGYDTTPVKSRTDVYYVYRGMDQGIVFVDANGKPVHGLRR